MLKQEGVEVPIGFFRWVPDNFHGFYETLLTGWGARVTNTLSEPQDVIAARHPRSLEESREAGSMTLRETGLQLSSAIQ